VDLDSDGILSGYELDFFYSEQRKKMESMLAEQISYDDILCQMIDMINPVDPKCIRLTDIKACPTSGVFFNVLFNLNKFIAFEQRDPFQAHAEKQGPEKTDWDRFARLEYDRMAQEAEQSEDFSDPSASDFVGRT
jgi:serine/threonine-protein phosphatase 2A regulatory subunit B''